MLHTSWQQKIFTKLLGLSYKIIYKRGYDNNAIDALSKRSSSAETYALSVSKPKWLDKVSASYEQDEFANDVIAKLTLDHESIPNSYGTMGCFGIKREFGWDQILNLNSS
jgi:hypothetical protein